MNAAEQALSLELATKIATVVTLFKEQLPDARADLKPWASDPETRELVDPESIDIAFHLPGWSPRFQARSILVQIRLYPEATDPTPSYRVIGVDAAGFSHQGEQWRLSTIGQWQFQGDKQPAESIKEKLKLFCRHTFELFNGRDEQRISA